MRAINFNDTEKDIVTFNILLTFEPPYLIDIVRLHMSLTLWGSICHWQCEGPSFTDRFSFHTSLRIWAAISH